MGDMENRGDTHTQCENNTDVDDIATHTHTRSTCFIFNEANEVFC